MSTQSIKNSQPFQIQAALPSQPDYFTSLPKEMLAHIFSFLSMKELKNLMSVCHKFKKLNKLPSIEEIKHSFQKADWRLSHISEKNYTIDPAFYDRAKISTFLSFHEGKFFFIQSGITLMVRDLNAYFNDCYETVGLGLLGETESYLFLGVNRSYQKNNCIQLICLDKTTEKILFTLDPTDLAFDQKGGKVVAEHICHFSLLNAYPLTFLTLLDTGFAITWEVNGNSLRQVESCFLFADLQDSSRKRHVHAFKNNLFLIESPTIEKTYYYLSNFKTGESKEISFPRQNILLSNLTYVIYENGKEACVKFELSDGLIEKYRIPLSENAFPLVVENLLIIHEKESLTVFDGNKGQKMHSLILPDGFFHCEKDQRLKGRLFGHLLFLFQRHNLLLIDLNTGSSLLKTVPDEEKIYSVVDGFLTKNELVLLLQSACGASVKTRMIYLNLVDALPEANPLIQEAPLDQSSQNPKNSIILRTGIVAFAAMDTLLLGLSIYFGINHSLNLSIGLGAASLLLGMSALGGYVVSKRKLMV